MQTSSGAKQGAVGLILRCLIVGLVYAAANALGAMLLGSLSRLQPSLGNFLVWLLSGALLCLVLAPFILHSSWSKWDTILAVWAVIAFVRSLGLGIEGALFKPTQAATAVTNAGSGILVGLLFAWLAVVLLQPVGRAQAAQPHAQQGWWSWTWRLLLVGLSYFIFYFVFGAANALLYTRSFYENNPQYGLSLPPAGVILVAELIRGPLFGLGSLFLVRSTSLSRPRTGVYLGLLLFVVGGLGPYLETTLRSMPPGFNLATILELFLQNFLTGLVAGRLYQ